MAQSDIDGSLPRLIVPRASGGNPEETHGMESLWAFLRAPAIHLAVARDAFVFDISWLGVVLVIAALFLLRYLRR